MTRTLKVYGYMDWRPATSDRNPQTREIVAASSKAEVERLAPPHAGRLQQLEETGNEAEIALAMSEPGVIFWTPLDDSHRPDPVWHRDNPLERAVTMPIVEAPRELVDQVAADVVPELAVTRPTFTATPEQRHWLHLLSSTPAPWSIEQTAVDAATFEQVRRAGREAAVPPGAEAFACAFCDQPFEAHVYKGADGKRRSSDGDCEGWTPYRKPEPFVPDPRDGCKVGHGEWHHGSGCTAPETCVCQCHAPRQLYRDPDWLSGPSWTCGRSLADGGYSCGPLCNEAAYYVVVAIDEYGRQLHEASCAEHLLQEIQDATVVYPTHPIQVSLTVIDQSCWKVGREAWRNERRLTKHRRKRP